MKPDNLFKLRDSVSALIFNLKLVHNDAVNDKDSFAEMIALDLIGEAKVLSEEINRFFEAAQNE